MGPSFFLINKRNLRPKTAPARDFRPAVGVRKIGFPLRRRLEKINFLGAGGPPPMIRCRTPQLAPTVNAPRIRRRLVARFSSKPCLEEIHSILSFCIRRMSISMGTWEALDGFPNQEHRSTSGDECIVRNTSNARMIHHTSPAGWTPAPRIRRRLDHTHAHTYTNLRLITHGPFCLIIKSIWRGPFF